MDYQLRGRHRHHSLLSRRGRLPLFANIFGEDNGENDRKEEKITAVIRTNDATFGIDGGSSSSSLSPLLNSNNSNDNRTNFISTRSPQQQQQQYHQQEDAQSNATAVVPILVLLGFCYMMCCTGKRPGPEYHRGELFREQARRARDIQRGKRKRNEPTEEDRLKQIEESVRTMKIISKNTDTEDFLLGPVAEGGISSGDDDIDGPVQSGSDTRATLIQSKGSTDTADTLPLEIEYGDPSSSNCSYSDGDDRLPIEELNGSDDNEEEFNNDYDSYEAGEVNKETSTNDDEDDDEDIEDDYICHVCLEGFKIGDRVMFHKKQHSGCSHVFHEECLLSWLLDHRENECPSCRAVFIEDEGDNSSSEEEEEERQERQTDCDYNDDDDDRTNYAADDDEQRQQRQDIGEEWQGLVTAKQHQQKLAIDCDGGDGECNGTINKDNDVIENVSYVISKGRIAVIPNADDDGRSGCDNNGNAINTNEELPSTCCDCHREGFNSKKRILRGSGPICYYKPLSLTTVGDSDSEGVHHGSSLSSRTNDDDDDDFIVGITDNNCKSNSKTSNRRNNASSIFVNIN